MLNRSSVQEHERQQSMSIATWKDLEKWARDRIVGDRKNADGRVDPEQDHEQCRCLIAQQAADHFAALAEKVPSAPAD